MICISAAREGNYTELLFTESEYEMFKDSKMKTIDEQRWSMECGVWDCVGDVLMNLCFAAVGGCMQSIKDRKVVIFTQNRNISEGEFYSAESLIKIIFKLKDWDVLVSNILQEDSNTMSKNGFTIEIPRFDPDAVGATSTMPLSNGNVQREYAHPLDLSLTRFLDNDIINGLFKEIVTMLADSSYGPVVASGIRVTSKTYPELDTIVNECASKLGIRRPYVIVSPVLSSINAMAFGSDEEPYIVISTLMAKTMDSKQLKFVIGHECGHIAMGHMTYHAVINMATNFAQLVPIIGPLISKGATLPLIAWSRRSEISADRAGLLCCDDIDVAKKTLLQLSMPFLDASKINIDDYVSDASSYLKGGVLRRINEFTDAHPIIPKRIHALDLYVSSKKYAKVHHRPVMPGAISDSELESQVEKTISVL